MRDFRNAMLCAAVVITAIFLTWPFAHLPFNDDWSYSFTVKRLAETGHFQYNGWATAMILTQAYWGLIWVKLLGFSFDVLRFSTIPLALGSVSMTYLLARRCGLLPLASVFVTLLLGLSPLFLPLAASFMNDVPGCFGLIATLYALVRCAQARHSSSALGWLITGVVIAAIGGMSRQSVWVVPIVLLPLIAGIYRGRWLLLFAASISWLLTLAIAIGLQHWFNAQPYALPEPSFQAEFTDFMRDPMTVVLRFIRILLTLVLLLLPAAIPVLGRMRSRSTAILAAVVLLAIVRFLYSQPRFISAPWMENTLAPAGVFNGAQIPGQPIVILPWPILPMLSILVFVVSAFMIAVAISELNYRQFARAKRDETALVATMMVAVAYLALLLTRCALNVSFDRHLLPLIPCAGIPILRWLGSPQISISSGLLLMVFAIYSIASVHDEFALARARVVATNRLENTGIPRTRIGGGLEYDFWTQLETTGYINDSRIKNPAGAFRPHVGRTPSVQPVYRVEYQPQADSVPSEFGTVTYFSFLPPFQRQISIDRVVHR